MRAAGRLLAVLWLGWLCAAPADAATRTVGTKTLRSCGSAWCGTLSRPLDPSRPAGRRIDIAFRWYAPRHSTGAP